MISYHNKKFRAIANSANGETSSDTIFHYKQEGNVVTASYSGGKITSGNLIALVDASGSLNMRYHQVNTKGELMTGVCFSTPEILPNGKIRLHEKWEWTSGDRSKGESIVEEI
jgi:hypothetical protein